MTDELGPLGERLLTRVMLTFEISPFCVCRREEQICQCGHGLRLSRRALCALGMLATCCEHPLSSASVLRAFHLLARRNNASQLSSTKLILVLNHRIASEASRDCWEEKDRMAELLFLTSTQTKELDLVIDFGWG